jgi:hypothetical protein
MNKALLLDFSIIRLCGQSVNYLNKSMQPTPLQLGIVSIVRDQSSKVVKKLDSEFHDEYAILGIDEGAGKCGNAWSYSVC